MGVAYTHVGQTTCIACNVLFGREEATWRPGHGWRDAVKMDLKEIRWQGIALVHLVFTKIHGLIVNTALNIRVS
jgi:hypothetical protein